MHNSFCQFGYRRRTAQAFERTLPPCERDGGKNDESFVSISRNCREHDRNEEGGGEGAAKTGRNYNDDDDDDDGNYGNGYDDETKQTDVNGANPTDTTTTTTYFPPILSAGSGSL